MVGGGTTLDGYMLLPQPLGAVSSKDQPQPHVVYDTRESGGMLHLCCVGGWVEERVCR